MFNPITNEKRSPYPLNNVEPLQETWIRISDDEDALARIWNDEFKKLAGAVVPVKRWDNHDDHTRRPQNNIWAVIDGEHTAPLGMTTGVGLPPRLWTIIDAADVEEVVEQEGQGGERMSDWRDSGSFCEHTTSYLVGFDRFEFNPAYDEGEITYDMTSLELIQEGLMKALLDVQRRIRQQARDDVK